MSDILVTFLQAGLADCRSPAHDFAGDALVDRSNLVVFRSRFPAASVATLTFLSVLLRVLRRHVRVKATLESYGCSCPFGSDIRKSASCDMMRMSEPGH